MLDILTHQYFISVPPLFKIFVLNLTQKNIIKKYPINRGMKVFYLLYGDIIFKNLLLSTDIEIIVAKFKSKSISLEN